MISREEAPPWAWLIVFMQGTYPLVFQNGVGWFQTLILVFKEEESTLRMPYFTLLWQNFQMKGRGFDPRNPPPSPLNPLGANVNV
jgi:hypothetical protein